MSFADELLDITNYPVGTYVATGLLPGQVPNAAAPNLIWGVVKAHGAGNTLLVEHPGATKRVSIALTLVKVCTWSDRLFIRCLPEKLVC